MPLGTHAFNRAYHHLSLAALKLLLATYFGALQGNLHLAANLPVAGLHVDTINAGQRSAESARSAAFQ